MTTLVRILFCALFLVVVVVVGLPPSRRTEEQRDANQHMHVRRPSPTHDKLLAIGVPMAMSRYMDYAAPAPATATRSWWGRSNYFYRAVFKCAAGEKRDALGICRQPWDSIDPDDYFSS